MLFEDNDFDINMAFFIPDVNFDSSVKLVNTKEGFLKGNMFKNEYEPYKNFSYMPLNASSEKEKRLYQIMALEFAINDLNLYLDLHPDDKEILNQFKKIVEEVQIKQDEYVKKYGPLMLNQVKGNKFNWIDSPWPWDNEGGSSYV